MIGWAGMAQAENWMMRDGTESKNAPAVRVFGLIQPTYQHDYSNRLEGLVGLDAAHNGEYPLSALIGPGYKSISGYYLFRVRVGARGLVDPMINYEVVLEAGANALTTQVGEEFNTELAEGSITLNHVPGARLRLGLFKTPGSEEALRTAIDYVNFTNVTFRFINYQPVERLVGPVTPYGVPGQTSSGVRAYRDTGVQLFDAFTYGNQEVSYAVMAGNGSTLNQTDDNARRAYYGRLQWSHIFPQSQGHLVADREDLTAFVWRHNGQQEFDGASYGAVREGLGFSLLRHPVHLTVEYMRGEGMVLLTPVFRGDPLLVFPGKDNEGSGWYADVGYFVTPHVMVELRYDVMDLLKNLAPVHQQLRTATIGAQYYFSKNARIAFNYEVRDYSSRSLTAADGDAYHNAQRVSDSVGNRLAIQASLKF
jgi:hypothetical protein